MLPSAGSLPHVNAWVQSPGWPVWLHLHEGSRDVCLQRVPSCVPPSRYVILALEGKGTVSNVPLPMVSDVSFAFSSRLSTLAMVFLPFFAARTGPLSGPCGQEHA